MLMRHVQAGQGSVLPVVEVGEDYPELRESVRRICAKYPAAYWRELEKESAYPTAFIRELTEGGFLAALIPEEYGGAGMPLRAAAVILEEINASGCTASQGHAQMYIMGTLLRHGSDEQKRHYLPRIASGELRLQAFGLTEPTSGSDTTSLKTRAVRQGDSYIVNGQKIWTSRALHSDLMLLLARTTPLDDVKRKTEGLSVFLVHIPCNIGRGLTIRPIEAMINHNATESFSTTSWSPPPALLERKERAFGISLTASTPSESLLLPRPLAMAGGAFERRLNTLIPAWCLATLSVAIRASSSRSHAATRSWKPPI